MERCTNYRDPSIRAATHYRTQRQIEAKVWTSRSSLFCSHRSRCAKPRQRQPSKWQITSGGVCDRLLSCVSPLIKLQACAVPLQKSGRINDNLELLPVGSSYGGRKQRFVWDGKAIKVVDTEELSSKQTKRQHLTAQLRDWRSSVLSAFLPDKELVTSDYWGYSFWRNSHRFFSSATTVFATQVTICCAAWIQRWCCAKWWQEHNMSCW